MLTTLFGSCRIISFASLLKCTSINEDVSYVHSTKEVLQLIKVLKGWEVLNPDMYQYAFRAGILKKGPIEISQKIIGQFDSTELFIIEICSMKKYRYNGTYLHHLSVDSKWGRDFWKSTPASILSKVTVEEQTKEEIESDIVEILNILSGKEIIFITHILPNNDKLSKRKYLINLITNICKDRGIDLISPTECLTENLLSEDLGHYNPEMVHSTLIPYFRKKLIEIGLSDALIR